MSPTVSIIMPTYNRASLIMETIASVQKQTYENWELIIVDDGSDDNTGELIAQLHDDRIQFIKAGRRGIVGKIKNLGIERSSGELIAFIDSDDLWHESKLENQVDALNKFPGAGFSLTGGYDFKNPGVPVKSFNTGLREFKPENIFLQLFQSRIAAYMPSLMMRRKCIDVTGRFSENKNFTDAEFMFNLAQHFDAIILTDLLVYRRLHDANDHSDRWEANAEDGIRMIRSYEESLPSKIFRKALFRAYIQLGEKAIFYKKKKTAIKNFLKAWKFSPLSIVPAKKFLKAILKA